MGKKDKKKKRKEERRQLEMQSRHPPVQASYPPKQTHHPPVTLNLKYDAAQTTAENVRHWAMADHLSADGSLTPEIRRTLRNRARYEIANNAYAKGLVLTLAATCIGTGPRLQLLSEDDDFNTIVETEFIAWAETITIFRYRLRRFFRLSRDSNSPNSIHYVSLSFVASFFRFVF